MSILNNRIKLSLTTSSGSASDTITSQGLCHQILVEPTTATTQYDLSILDSDSLEIFGIDNEVGTMNQLITLPITGTYTVSLANATADEAFTILIAVRNS